MLPNLLLNRMEAAQQVPSFALLNPSSMAPVRRVHMETDQVIRDRPL